MTASPDDAPPTAQQTQQTQQTDQQTDQQTEQSSSAPDNRWRAFSVCLVAVFMTLLDVSIVNVALPSLRTGLSASSSDLQWVSSGYALAFGLALVPSGRLGDVRGRRTMFLIGLTLFTVSSALCGLAPSPGLLIAARLLQGIAGGMLQPQVSGFIQELFQGKERARAFGFFGATVGLSTAVGPLIGGGLIALFGTDHGWRAVFFVNVPVGLVAIPLAMKLLPAASGKRESKGLDPIGVLLLGGGVLLLLLPIVESQTWSGVLPWLLLVPAAALLAGFFGWERQYRKRGKDPMVDIDLLKVRSYSLGSALGLLYFSGFTAIFFVFALFLQEGHHYTALQSGLSLTPFAVGSGVSAWVSGRLINRLGRPLVVAGLVLVILGVLVTHFVVLDYTGHNIGLAVALPMMVAGIGSGAVISPNLTLTLSEVPVAQAGTASGILQTGQRIGGAAGIAAVGSLFFSRLAADHGHWGSALASALLLCVGLTSLALVLSLVDLYGRRHDDSDQEEQQHEAQPAH